MSTHGTREGSKHLFTKEHRGWIVRIPDDRPGWRKLRSIIDALSRAVDFSTSDVESAEEIGLKMLRNFDLPNDGR